MKKENNFLVFLNTIDCCIYFNYKFLNNVDLFKNIKKFKGFEAFLIDQKNYILTDLYMLIILKDGLICFDRGFNFSIKY